MAARQRTNQGLFRSTVAVVVLGILARVLGFVRDQVTGARFGLGAQLDAMTIATMPSTIVTNIFAFPISATLMPVLSTVAQERGQNHKFRLVRYLAGLVFGITVLLAGLGALTVSPFISVFVPTLSSDLRHEAVLSGILGYVAVPFAVLAVLLKGLLESQGSFKISSLQPILINGVVIALLLSLPNASISTIVMGMTLGTVLHFFLEFGPVRTRWRGTDKLDFRPELVQLLRLSTPVVIGVLVSQVNVIVDRYFLSDLMAGSIVALNYADRVRQLPLGVLIGAIYTTSFPAFSALVAERRTNELQNAVSKAVWLTLITLLPFVIGLMILAGPLVEILFQHGRFDATATGMTARALQAYAPGMLGLGLSQVMMGVMFAQGKTGRALGIATAANIANILLDPLLVSYFGYVGVAWANTIAVFLQTVVMVFALPASIRANFPGKKVLAILLACLATTLIFKLGFMTFPGLRGLSALLYWSVLGCLAIATYMICLLLGQVSEVVEVKVQCVSRLQRLRGK